MKKKKRKNVPNLRIDPKEIGLLKKWGPRHKASDIVVSRPIDIVRLYRIGLREVLKKLSELLPDQEIIARTKLPQEIVDLVQLNGSDINFWPTLKRENAKKGKSKPIRDPGIAKTQSRNKKKRKRKGSIAPPILTPIGGQPGYRMRYRFK